jgi:hypothetical protein
LEAAVGESRVIRDSGIHATEQGERGAKGRIQGPASQDYVGSSIKRLGDRLDAHLADDVLT